MILLFVFYTHREYLHFLKLLHKFARNKKNKSAKNIWTKNIFLRGPQMLYKNKITVTFLNKNC